MEEIFIILQKDGSVFTIGRNNFGQLGNGNIEMKIAIPQP